MDAPLTHEDFQPHLDSEFRVSGHPQVLRLTKIDVRDHPPLPHLNYKAFALLFSGPRAPVLPEGFHTVEANGRRFDLYVIPIHTPAHDRQNYQVIFN
jgi:hypothetical protein